ncbi:MAG: AraC family transcriptional regulator, partial [Paenibacillus sp.]|nr:AraC family transcriptional regulator [Paenibacillus sp.]
EPYFEQIFNTSLRIGNPLEPFKRLRNARIRLEAKERVECEQILTQVNRFYDERDHRQYTRLLVAFYDLLLFIGGQYGDSEVEVPYPSQEKELLTNEIIDFIEQHFTEELRLESIESKFHMSKYHLSRTFTEVTGLTIFEYLCQRRINQAKLLLHQEHSANLVSDVCYRVGYNHPEHFSRVFKKLVGMSPNQYRKLIR